MNKQIRGLSLNFKTVYRFAISKNIAMSANANPSILSSRRKFIYQTGLGSLALLGSGKWAMAAFDRKPDSLIRGVQIGVITYSFRSLPGHPDQLIQYCRDAGISAIELMGDSIEEFAGKPVNTIKMPPRIQGKPYVLPEEIKQQLAEYNKQVADWRASVSMSPFREVRKKFHDAGISIYAFKPNALGMQNTDAEIEYALRAAKTLGAQSVTTELPVNPAHTQRLGDLAAKQGIYIGYHAHLQATDTAWDTALSQSPYNSMNLDCGHYIAAGGNNTPETLLALIEAKHSRITSMHIKDRLSKQNGGANQPWGKGNTPLREILTLLREKKYKIPATIELEYDIPAGSDAVKETRKCLDFAREIIENS
jgi:sugar phosphate isomerase/epimerase